MCIRDSARSPQERRAGGHHRRPRSQGRYRQRDRATSRMSVAAHADREVVVIGSGPAGLTAALYAARANLRPLLIEGLEAGGQLMLTTMVENFPGFEEGIMGPDLMAEMRAQAEKFGADMVQDHVSSVDLCAHP